MRSIILILSIVLGLLPLAGVAWLIAGGMITPWPPSFTVDGLFMGLILLTLSLCFLLNAFWEMRDQGILKNKKDAAPAKAPAAKAS